MTTWVVLLASCAFTTFDPPADAVVVAPEPVRPVEPPPPVPGWPAAGAPLVVLDTPLPDGWAEARVILDAGHGAPGNAGNTSVRCEEEQAFTRRTAEAVAPLLGPGIAVETTRAEEPVGYGDRIARANSWPAHAIIGLHSDVREGWGTAVDPATGCWGNRGAFGFTVLWSDDGRADRVEGRQRLARAIAARMIEAGFPPYCCYSDDLYEVDPAHPGVFVDRHAPGKKIRMLREPRVPTVIVETHQAWDAEEAARWEEPATHAAFAAALRAAIVDVRR